MNDVLKKTEFKAFIKTISEGNVGHWIEIARALNVDPDTITRWKELPEAKEAIQRGIDNALAGMETAGKKDWRMHEAKLKMLGINPATKIEATIDDPRKDILNKYLGDGSAGETSEAESRPPKNTA